MAYPQTGSTLVNKNQKNITSTSLSTNILIRVEGGDYIGAVQTLTVNESRPGIKMVDEVGTDGHIDSCPNGSTNITGSCQRIRFDGARIAEAFGRGYVHVSAQAYPFDLVIEDKSRSDVNNQVTTVIKNVWIKSIDVTYSVSDWIIVENMNWEAEAIYSYRGGAAAAASGGVRSMKISASTTELEADKGARRGALDASGLIDLNTDQNDYPGSTGGLF